MNLKELFKKMMERVNLIDRPHFKRHRDDDIIDKIEIDVVPRYKTSGLSGDEWRVRAVLRCWRKGHLIVERSYRRVEDAAAALPWVLKTWNEGIDPMYGEEERKRWDGFLELENWLCHQPGCSEPSTRIYKLKEQFSMSGQKLDAEENSLKYVRSFCERHAIRGDCGREDADRNYKAFAGGPPGDGPFPAEDESRAVLGAVIEVDSLDEVPERLKKAVDGMMPDRKRRSGYEK